MDKIIADKSIKKANIELFSLNPSSLITLFEVDLSEIGFNRGVITQREIDQEIKTVFRLHNNIKLINSSIYWKGKEYQACPIQADGFEISARGTLPTPTLSISVSDEGIPYLTQFKERLLVLGDLVGSKVTRIRTFAKYLDFANFIDSVPPEGFSPDQNTELPKDIYYIEKKSAENKNMIQYQLASILDVEGIKLPARLVLNNSCPFTYRGEGCLYEFSNRRDEETHGDSNYSSLPDQAPPVANNKDEEINIMLGDIVVTSDRGEYNLGMVYNIGDSVFLSHRGIKYYFVSKINNNSIEPPNSSYWIADECSKTVMGCKLRWSDSAFGTLPYGGFCAVNKSL